MITKPAAKTTLRLNPLTRVLLLGLAWSTIAQLNTALSYAATGEEIFAKACAACHGLDGKAKTPAGRKLGAKDLSGSKVTDAEVEKQITEGRKDNQGLQKMPAFKGALTPEEIKSLIPIVKKFRK